MLNVLYSKKAHWIQEYLGIQLLAQWGSWENGRLYKQQHKGPLPLTSVTAMVINIITIFHSRNGFNFHFILQQIIWEMINEIFNYRLSLS